jgi:hypothetical protein
MLDVIPRSRIKLTHSLKDALDDVRPRPGLENALQIVIASVVEKIVLPIISGDDW